jgi:tRNA1Val (adenine37-N6)-methyltransferase
MISSEKCSESFASDEVTYDKIYSENTYIAQYKKGYRFNADSMILSWFISIFLKKNNRAKGLEIGAGAGIIPIILQRRGILIDIDCIEIQKSLFKLLEYNIKQNNALNLNPVLSDFRLFSKECENKYDIIFTNPPYHPSDTGIINPSMEKAVAKHEFNGDLKTFFELSFKILMPKGEFFFVYPQSRIQFALSSAENSGLYLKDIYFFKEKPLSPVNLFAAKMVKTKKCNCSDSKIITMRNIDGSYSKTGREILFRSNE